MSSDADRSPFPESPERPDCSKAGLTLTPTRLALLALEHEVAVVKRNPSPAFLPNVADAIRGYLEADGVAIALTDSKGLRCYASTGNAPSVGMRLQSDSFLTKESFETGKALLCRDAEYDPRVDPVVARMLKFRSAAVIPIHVHRSVLGVVEVFSARPSAFDTKQVIGLARVAQLLAPVAKIEHSRAVSASAAPVLLPASELPALSGRRAQRIGLNIAVGSSLALLFLLAFFALFWNLHSARKSAISRNITAPQWTAKKLTPPAADPVAPVPDTASPTEPDPPEKQDSASVDSLSDNSSVAEIEESKPLPPGISHNEVPTAKIAIPDTTTLSSKSLPPTLGRVPLPVPPEPVESAAIVAPVISRATPPPLVEPIPNFVLDRTLSGHPGWNTGVAFSTDDRLVISGSWNHGVQRWNLATGQELARSSGARRIQALAYSRNGRWVAAENSDNSVTLWNASTMREVRTWPGKRFLSSFKSTWVYSIAFSPDSHWLASAVDNKTIRLWNVDTGLAGREFIGSGRSVLYVAFSPDGRLLASGMDDKKVGIWNVATGEVIHVLSGHKGDIDTVAFSPDGRLLASAGEDRSIKLWDLSTGREVRSLKGHTGRVSTLSFSPDGKWLASGSWDKSVKIWDVSSGRELESFSGAHDVYSVSFDSRGNYLASGSDDGKVILWRIGDSAISAQSAEKVRNAED